LLSVDGEKIYLSTFFQLFSFSLTCAGGQARIQVTRFGGNTFLGGKIFVFIWCSKKIFLDTTNFGENKNIWWSLPPNAPRGYGPAGGCDETSVMKGDFNPLSA